MGKYSLFSKIDNAKFIYIVEADSLDEAVEKVKEQSNPKEGERLYGYARPVYTDGVLFECISEPAIFLDVALDQEKYPEEEIYLVVSNRYGTVIDFWYGEEYTNKYIREHGLNAYAQRYILPAGNTNWGMIDNIHKYLRKEFGCLSL